MERTLNRYEKIGEFVTRKLGDESILVPVRTGPADLNSVWVLNGVASSIWALLDSAADDEAITARVVAEYDVAPEKASLDVAACLGSLAEAGLIRCRETRETSP